jgi:hypothetical protein
MPKGHPSLSYSVPRACLGAEPAQFAVVRAYDVKLLLLQQRQRRLHLLQCIAIYGSHEAAAGAGAATHVQLPG